MNKTCKVCGRTCAKEDMQCLSCRSREFEGQPSPTEAYKAAQSSKAKLNKLQDVEQQVDDLSSFPLQWERPLAYVGLISLGLFFLLPKVLGKAALIIGGFAFGISLFLSRVRDTSHRLETKADRLRKN